MESRASTSKENTANKKNNAAKRKVIPEDRYESVIFENDNYNDDDDDSDYVCQSEHSSYDSSFIGSSEYDSESDREGSLEMRDPREWCVININRIPPPPPRFVFTGEASLNFNVEDENNVLHYFELYFDLEIIELISQETNRFAEQCLLSTALKPNSRSKHWKETSVNEVWIFLGVLILQGIVYKPKQEWYWSKKKIITTPFFAEIMSQRRFCLIMKYLHFTNNNEIDLDTHPQPKLYKLYEFIEKLRNKFKTLYTPNRDITIDESLLLYKGRLGWRQYIPLKRARFGIKFFMLCEAESGYIWDMVIYTGKGTITSANYTDFPVSTKVVMNLIEPFLGKGYCLTVDNFYTSPQLADLLIANKTYIYGTLRKNRKGLPEEYKTTKLKKGEIAAYQKGKVMALKWKDKKNVCLMSTIHDAPTATVKIKGKDVIKPKVVLDYNGTMGGVDRADQELSFYPSTRKQQKKYYKKIFRHTMDLAIWNSFLLYKKKCPNSSYDLLSYKIALVESIVEKYFDINMQPKKGRPSDEPNPMRLVGRHFPDFIPPNAIKENPTRKCAICCKKSDPKGKKIRKESRYWCKDCEVGLCVAPCFRIYHTQNNL